MRISDWSSDVCSSDLVRQQAADVLQIGERDIGHRVLRLRAFGAAAHVGTDEAPWPGEARRQRLEIAGGRSEERSVGKECGSTCRYRWTPEHYTTKQNCNIRHT